MADAGEYDGGGLPPPKGNKPLGAPKGPAFGGGGGVIAPPRPRPPVTKPKPPIEFPRPPVEMPKPPKEVGKTIQELIREWLARLPGWLKWAIALIIIGILLWAVWRGLKRYVPWILKQIKELGLWTAEKLNQFWEWLKSIFKDRPPPSDEDPPVVVAITGVMFNYDRTRGPAINIRRSFSREVRIPEWTPDERRAEQSPAAYAIAQTPKTVYIYARFAAAPPRDMIIEVRAKGGGVLGIATQRQVLIRKGMSSPEWVRFALSAHQIGKAGIRRSDIAWTWECRLPGQKKWASIGVTKHRIYEVLDVPTLPWKQQSYPNTQNPWTDVLDIACGWAAGKKDALKAAEMVTRAVNAPAGAVSYRPKSRYTKYVSTSRGGAVDAFLCSAYVMRVRYKRGAPEYVNCTDCAAIVSTFSNILGADLGQSRIDTVRGVASFRLNPIIPIGLTANPGYGAFYYHEVAWSGGAGENDTLCDACLKVSVNGPNAPLIYTLPIHRVFKMPYKPQLVAPVSLPHAIPWPPSNKRRPVI